MKYTDFGKLFVSVLVVVGCLGQKAYSASDDPIVDNPPEPVPEECGSMSMEECDMMKAINEVRESKGLDPLQALSTCVEAAGDHAEDMVDRGYFSHNSPGESWSKRMRRYGLKGTYVGENIAYGGGVERTVKAWMNSPGHRRNILKPQYKSSGIGYAVSESGRPYWVQCFAGFPGDL